MKLFHCICDVNCLFSSLMLFCILNSTAMCVFFGQLQRYVQCKELGVCVGRADVMPKVSVGCSCACAILPRLRGASG